ncbi:MAG TPA: ribonuclease H-like domain-containing protein [Nitrospira sp.]|nr:ribonuclease H-like domain-containing protein [Nitrospira sp.]
MLTSTFVLLKGIGPGTERRLWGEGVTDWGSFLNKPTICGISLARKAWYDRDLTAALSFLQQGRADYFGTCLRSRDHWRLFETFRHRALYLDIETTGMAGPMSQLTVVGLYRNGRMSTLIRGDSLSEDRLQEELEQSDLLVTFFGSAFDIPYLQAAFPRLNFKKPHFDLCFAARRLGLRGGLKAIEQELQIDREADLQGLDGWDAVRLWHQWQGGDESSLDTLIRYNAADTTNLEALADHLYGRMVAQFGPQPLVRSRDAAAG